VLVCTSWVKCWLRNAFTDHVRIDLVQTTRSRAMSMTRPLDRTTAFTSQILAQMLRPAGTLTQKRRCYSQDDLCPHVACRYPRHQEEDNESWAGVIFAKRGTLELGGRHVQIEPIDKWFVCGVRPSSVIGSFTVLRLCGPCRVADCRRRINLQLQCGNRHATDVAIMSITLRRRCVRATKVVPAVGEARRSAWTNSRG